MAKQDLQKLIQQLKEKKKSEEQKKWQEEQAKGVMSELQKEQTQALKPVLENMAKVMSDKMTDEFTKAVSKIKVDAPQIPEMKMPEIRMPDYPVFNVPEPKVTVNFDASKIRVPDIMMPEMMDVKGMVSLAGVDMEHPLPVTLRDKDGKPVDLATWTTSVIGGAGKADYFTVKGIQNTVGVVTVNPDGTPVYGGTSSGGTVSVSDIFGTVGTNVVNPDGRIKVELPTGSSGLTDAELRASSVPVSQASDTVFSTKVVSIFGSTITSLLNGDNRIPVSVETGGSGLTDAELRASSVPVAQASGANWSVYVTGSTGTIGVVTIDPDGNPTYASSTSGLTDTELRASSVPVAQASDAIWSTNVTNTVTVSGTLTSTGAYLLNGDGTYRDTMPVSGSVAVSGVTGTIGANIVDSSGVAYTTSNPLPIGDAGGSITIDGSVAVTGVTGSIGATILNGEGLARDSWLVSDVTNSVKTALIDSSGVQYSGSNPLPVTFTGSSSTSVSLVNADGTYYNSDTPLPVTLGTRLDATIDSISTYQASGANFSVYVTGASGTIAANIVDSSGIAYSGSNPLPFSLVTNATSTVNVVNVDSAGAYRSTFPVSGTVAVSGVTGSIVVVGEVVSDAADTGNAPIKIGGIARTANPTAVANGDRVSASMDDLGRQIVRPVQVRDLISTAYVSKTTGSTFGTETTLFAGATNTYHDLIYVLASNDSTAAIGMDIRGTTAGNILMHLEIPANSTTGLSLPVPLPAGDVGASWTIDLPDVTGTNVYVSALFTKEV